MDGDNSEPQESKIQLGKPRKILHTFVPISLMFPIPKGLQVIKDFSAEDPKRKRLLIEELAYCNKHARRIKSKALHVYRTATSGEDAQMAAVCCDFKALERYVRERYGDDRG